MAFFATFVLDSALVQQIMRWDMAVLRESPWYQQIFREGEQRGRREEILSGIELALEIKFSTEGLQLMPEISQISDLEQLKAIYQGVLKSNNLREVDGMQYGSVKRLDAINRRLYKGLIFVKTAIYRVSTISGVSSKNLIRTVLGWDELIRSIQISST